MKLETDENTIWLSLILMAGLVVISLIFGGFYYETQRTQEAFKAGLMEVPDSSTGTHYAK